MRILIDTHSLIWFIGGSSRLSAAARQLIEDMNNERFLSVVSRWEIAIKMNIGKLHLGQTFEQLFPHQLDSNSITLLNISIQHLTSVSILPLKHRDPFYRLLIAQSCVEQMPIISADTAFDAYAIQRLW